jgi:hypothetical protein
VSADLRRPSEPDTSWRENFVEPNGTLKRTRQDVVPTFELTKDVFSAAQVQCRAKRGVRKGGQ